MKITPLRTWLLLAGFLPLASFANPTLLVHETFADGNYTTATQDGSGAYTSLDWAIRRTNGANVSVGGGALTLTSTATATGQIAAAQWRNSPAALTPGQYVSLNFDVSMSTALVNTFRIGIYNAHDDPNTVGTGGSTSTGYMAMLNFNPSAGGNYISLNERDPSVLINTVGFGMVGGPQSSGTSVFSTLSLYHLDFTLALLNENQLEVSMTITGDGLSSPVAISYIDTPNATTGMADMETYFNQIAFQNNSQNSPLSISNLRIEMGAVPIPEPSTYAMLMALAALGLVALRRHRQNRSAA
ncbi:MAG: PEP-CTERM sorting domain-containing protein [Candidatus Didemnitutus sp.]|nr:PEP-CTERM sorting domain-containing protein [Candidatus Didemnitutus sp.]